MLYSFIFSTIVTFPCTVFPYYKCCSCGPTVGRCGWTVGLCGQSEPTLVNVPTQGWHQLCPLGSLYGFSMGSSQWVTQRIPSWRPKNAELLWTSHQLSVDKPIVDLPKFNRYRGPKGLTCFKKMLYVHAQKDPFTMGNKTRIWKPRAPLLESLRSHCSQRGLLHQSQRFEMYFITQTIWSFSLHHFKPCLISPGRTFGPLGFGWTWSLLDQTYPERLKMTNKTKSWCSVNT